MFVPGKTTRIPRTRVSHCHVWFCPKIKDPWEHMLPHFISWLPSSKLTSMWKIQISRLFSRGFPMVFYLYIYICLFAPRYLVGFLVIKVSGPWARNPRLTPSSARAWVAWVLDRRQLRSWTRGTSNRRWHPLHHRGVIVGSEPNRLGLMDVDPLNIAMEWHRSIATCFKNSSCPWCTGKAPVKPGRRLASGQQKSKNHSGSAGKVRFIPWWSPNVCNLHQRKFSLMSTTPSSSSSSSSSSEQLESKRIREVWTHWWKHSPARNRVFLQICGGSWDRKSRVCVSAGVGLDPGKLPTKSVRDCCVALQNVKKLTAAGHFRKMRSEKCARYCNDERWFQEQS